jgi:hypothetical protein
MVDAKKIEAGSLWRHKKRGSVYRVIDGSAQVQAPEDSGLTDYEVVVVYQSKAGETWVRRHSEFLDGRFEKLSEPPSKEWQTRMAAAEDGHEVGAGATLSLAGEDAGLPCHADQVAEIERRLMRNLGYENSHSHKVAFDQFANELHRMWSEDYRSLSLRVEAEKRAREEAERWKGILHKQVDDFAERYAQAGQDANKLRVDLRSAETHSAALARALEELVTKVDAFWNDPERPSVHRMRSKSVHELSDAQRRAQSLLAPKEDTNA